MAPHNALQTPEIIHHIMWYLGYTPDWSGLGRWSLYRSERDTLVRVAKTCRLFCSPALDVLWRNMISLKPLFRVIPSFTQMGKEINFEEAVSLEQWERFKIYARRIRNYVAYAEDDDGLGYVFNLALQQMGGAPLLPSLVSLSMAVTKMMPMLLSPTLRDITIRPRHTVIFRTTQLSLLQSIFEGSPSLHGVTIFGQLRLESYGCLLRFAKLRRLTLDASGLDKDKDPSAVVFPLDVISSFPALVELDLTLPKFYTLSPPDFIVGPNSLPALRVLSISAPTETIHGILSAVTDLALERLSITITRDEVWRRRDQWTETLKYIPRWSSTLLEIQLRAPPVYPRRGLPEEESLDGFSALQPLLSCHRLQRFTIEEFTYILSDNAIAQIAEAWPDLRVFHLQGALKGTSTSIESLQIMAMALPKLEELALRMDLRVLPPQRQDSPQWVSYGLRRMHLDEVVLPNDVFALADRLDALFPSLEVHYKPTGGQGDTLPRTTLKRLLNICHVARRRAGGSYCSVSAQFLQPPSNQLAVEREQLPTFNFGM